MPDATLQALLEKIVEAYGGSHAGGPLDLAPDQPTVQCERDWILTGAAAPVLFGAKCAHCGGAGSSGLIGVTEPLEAARIILDEA